MVSLICGHRVGFVLPKSLVAIYTTLDCINVSDTRTLGDAGRSFIPGRESKNLPGGRPESATDPNRASITPDPHHQVMPIAAPSAKPTGTDQKCLFKTCCASERGGAQAQFRAPRGGTRFSRQLHSLDFALLSIFGIADQASPKAEVRIAREGIAIVRDAPFARLQKRAEAEAISRSAAAARPWRFHRLAEADVQMAPPDPRGCARNSGRRYRPLQAADAEGGAARDIIDRCTLSSARYQRMGSNSVRAKRRAASPRRRRNAVSRARRSIAACIRLQWSATRPVRSCSTRSHSPP